MSVEAVEFFRDVDALCHQNQFLFQTVIFQLYLRIYQVYTKLLIW
ncbi:hypothetical protein PZA22_04060 [Pectobacterium polaris]|nr:hypothetical protein [Pectobacterium polaris]MDE8753688.1 hypothetical protein [Pectobacterium polaris]